MKRRTAIPRGALLACLVCVGLPATAQRLETAGPPAEFPPDGYEDRQFVDSRGCVYIRAGVDGTVTWVPRVNRDREHLCGFEPTFAEAPAPDPAPEAVPPEGEAAPRRAERETAAASEPAARAQETSAAPRRAAGAATGTAAAAPRAAESARTRILPKPDPEAVAVAVPGGYELAWEDGRLNPYRGARTPAGGAQMRTVWTDTIPRRLVDPARRAVVATREAQAPSADGASRRPQVSSRDAPVRPGRDAEAAAGARPAAGEAAVRAGVSDAPSGRRFVQVGTFGVAANARRTAERIAGLGLPVRVVRASGYRVVLAGPFEAAGDLRGTLDAARGAGFGDAFLRD
ncbi:SPOR domain-containing protein [Rhodosalinus sediminis]|uniref:SPOR domain-containing protein n=1 Tax=Rhodosalinus sediminis TaxID=1940533 RepID=A0A3D9BZ17_9RHOB|nr:SPOR domain-containing protein [Rhodosalinus sediminis]REC58783.1 SPOR domain-containing protein [Rhodosalinus sediminis]